MTFNIIAAGQLGQASKVMENFRHVNYGSALLPVDANGAGVDATIDLGSSSAGFKDGFFSGEIAAATQPYLFLTAGSTGSSGNITNFTTSENTGGFTVASGKVTPPSPGLYLVTINGDLAVDAPNVVNYLYIRKYNSVDTLLFNAAMVSAQTRGDDYTIAGSGSVTLRFGVGDYFFAAYGETAGGASASNVVVSFFKMV